MRTYGKALSAVAVAAVLSATTMASPASAATIKTERVYSKIMSEYNFKFVCPPNMVMTGRSHYGDENSKTTYHCSRILIDGEPVEVHSSEDWTRPQWEARADFSAPDNQVIVGRWHEGDENGDTRYRTGALYWQGRQVMLIDGDTSPEYRENSHTWKADDGKVMTGRVHYGDENGQSWYRFATLTFPG